jgi:predicted metal-dependent hydrolase
VTIPRYGSRREAEAFVRTRLTWIADRQSELRDSPRDRRWQPGTTVLWRGVSVRVSVDDEVAAGVVTVRCAELVVRTEAADDYRAPLERAMRRVAVQELPVHLLALAARHGLAVAGVSVRNQRSRWGSCSRTGRIALNWRLLQMPESVRDYILLHELMHLREQNHSPRFWALVAAVCPTHRESRAWLKREGLALC